MLFELHAKSATCVSSATNHSLQIVLSEWTQIYGQCHEIPGFKLYLMNLCNSCIGIREVKYSY